MGAQTANSIYSPDPAAAEGDGNAGVEESSRPAKRINLAEVISDKNKSRAALKKEELEIRRLEAENEAARLKLQAENDAARIKLQEQSNQMMRELLTRLTGNNKSPEA